MSGSKMVQGRERVSGFGAVRRHLPGFRGLGVIQRLAESLWENRYLEACKSSRFLDPVRACQRNIYFGSPKVGETQYPRSLRGTAEGISQHSFLVAEYPSPSPKKG